MDLHSARISIRPWQHYDEISVDKWPPYNDPLEPLWNLPRLSNDHWYSGFDFGGRRTWAVDDHTGHLAGRISLREVDQQRGSARLGITFGAPFIGRGLGTEALAMFLDYYFGELGFLTMVLDVAGPNQRAIHSYERLGFSYTGSDWRHTNHSFDLHVLDDPHYAGLRHFFRRGPRGMDVQFFDMELHKEHWESVRGKVRH